MWTRIILLEATLFLAQVPIVPTLSGQTPATARPPLAQRPTDPAPPIPRVACPPGCLVIFEGRTAVDIPIDYGIDGDLSQIAKAVLEITDDRGNLLLTKEVPVLLQGQFVWPKGSRGAPSRNRPR